MRKQNSLNTKHIAKAASIYGFPLMDLVYDMAVVLNDTIYSLTDARVEWEAFEYGKCRFEITDPHGKKHWISDELLASGLVEAHKRKLNRRVSAYPQADITELNRERINALNLYHERAAEYKGKYTINDFYAPVDRSCIKTRPVYL